MKIKVALSVRQVQGCNTVYKCIPKTLPDLISYSQAAVPGRRIRDNIVLAQELLKNYYKNQDKPRCALKVDLKKAFDSINWGDSFLRPYPYSNAPLSSLNGLKLV